MSTPADLDEPRLGSRSLLATLGVFAGLTIAVVLASVIAGVVERSSIEPEPVDERREPVAVREPEADVLAFLGPLATGERFDGWVIERIDPRREGAVPLALLGPDELRVEVELRPLDDRSPDAPASSETLAIYVRGRDTPRDALAGLQALAQAVRERESAGAILTGLEPLLVGH
jgi:hypothetical protein